MSDLEKELQGVTNIADDSPADGNDNQEVEEILEPGDEIDEAGDEDAAEDVESEAKPDRSIKNVRGELLRKQTEAERRILSQMDQRFAQILDLFKTFGATSQSKKPAQTFDDLSIQELEAMKGQVPDEQKEAFSEYLISRKVDAKISQSVSKVQEDAKYSAERTRANTIAVQRYPDLRNRTTQLFMEVDRRLRAASPEQIKYNPRIVMNIADDVAAELGVAPKQTSQARRMTTRPKDGDNKPVQRNEESGVNDAELNDIAKKLAPAMKGKSFNMKRVKERTKEYNKYFGGN